MKIFTLIILFTVMMCGSLSAQTNSVELKDGGGIVIGQHNSIQSAYDAIPGAISQAYTIEILTAYTGANETFPITFTNRTGGSNSNTITLRPAAGNTGEMVVGSSNLGTIILNNADYVIIDGRPGGTGSAPDLIIQNTVTSGTNANTLQFIGGASNNIVFYTHFKNATQGSAGPRTIEFADGAPNSNNIIDNCKVEGGRSGIGFDGDPGIENENNVIRNCEIFNFGYAGIWLLANSRRILIENNEIYQTVGINQTLNTGINIGASISDSNIIRNNKIHDIQSTSTGTGNTARGIWFQTNTSAGSVWNVYNNFIALPLNNQSAQNIIGIDINTAANNFTINCYYNSIRIGGTHTAGTVGNVVSAGIRSNSAGVTLNIKNNICINNRTGGTAGVVHTGFALTTAPTVKDIDFNTYFADGTNSFNAYWLGTGYTVLATYQAAATPDEVNTNFTNVTFVSLTDLHLAGASIGDTLLKGTPIAGITDDIDGNPRNAIAPYKGADEGDVVLNIQHNSNIANIYSLSQNYPNPFNPSTTINFSLPKTGFVSLKIYDIAGKEVANLVNGELATGSYQYVFDGSKLSSGVYFYSISAGSFAETKRMILVK
jgi:hypothetical protein